MSGAHGGARVVPDGMSGDVSDSAGSTDSVGIAGSGPEDLGSRPSDDVLLYTEKVHVERHASQGGPDAPVDASRMLLSLIHI